MALLYKTDIYVKTMLVSQKKQNKYTYIIHYS